MELRVAIRNLAEAEATCAASPAVISLVAGGANLRAHPHRLCARDVAAIIEFAPEPIHGLLIHCHMGESRSTAVGVGLLASWGFDPETAVATLTACHPTGRRFHPNPLVLHHFDQILGLDGALLAAGTRWLR
jgi:predicted protein tyrosine phosphatase